MEVLRNARGKQFFPELCFNSLCGAGLTGRAGREIVHHGN
jgi:hypothetical protein